jgi:hypothetical protein
LSRQILDLPPAPPTNDVPHFAPRTVGDPDKRRVAEPLAAVLDVLAGDDTVVLQVVHGELPPLVPK